MDILGFLGFQGSNVYGFVGCILLGVILFALAVYCDGREQHKLTILSVILSGSCLICLPALFV